MTIDDFRLELEKSGTVPEPLMRFAEYCYSSKLTSFTDFELTEEGSRWALAWFADDPEAARQFTVFAKTRDDSLFALWQHSQGEPGARPVVFLASECEGSRVIADSISEFLSCLAFGSDDFVMDIPYSDDEEWDGVSEANESLESIRHWLQEELEIMVADSPRATILRAMGHHPSLMDWIESWQANVLGG